MTTSGLYVYQYEAAVILPSNTRTLLLHVPIPCTQQSTLRGNVLWRKSDILNTNVVIYTAEKTHPPNEREGIRTVDRATRGIFTTG